VIVQPPIPRTFGPSAAAARLCVALFAVLSTYNPSGASYVHWLLDRWPQDWMLQVPVAVVYGFIYYFLIRAALRALRPAGIGLTIAVLGSIVWVLLDLGALVISGPGDVATLILYMFGALLAVGMSWMRIWTLLTGQVPVETIDRA
jgi:hypothetical protein